MGNCFHIQELDLIECHLCSSGLKYRYILCAFCKHRFHYHCMSTKVPALDCCANCNHRELRFIDIKRNTKTEDYLEAISIKENKHVYIDK